MNDIQTILIEPDEERRVALRGALRSQPGIEVASEATNATTGLVLLESIDVDVAIVDAHLPDMSIAEFTQQMQACQTEAGGVKISKLLILFDPQAVETLVNVWTVPAAGYCRKDAPIEQIAAAIRDINSGHQYLDAMIAQSSVDPVELANSDIHLQFNQMGAFI